MKVALHAADPLSLAGLADHLEHCREIVVLPDDQRGLADVVVVATYRFPSDLALSVQRRVADLAVPVVLVAGDLDEAELAVAGRCGVVAVLSRVGLETGELVACLLSAAAGGVAGPEVSLHPPPRATTAALSPREEQVLRLLADGLGTAEIAQRMSYSERTVKNVIHATMIRLNVRNRAHAVAYALRTGLI